MRDEISRELKNKAIASACIGVFFVVGVCVSYIGEGDRIFEMTFLSNFLSGGILIFGALKIALSGRDIPHFLYLDATALLLTVVGVCAYFAPAATFLTPSVVLHLINPSIMLAYYLLFCDAHGCGYGAAFTSIAFPSAYYLFMVLYGSATGKSVYEYFDTTAMSDLTLVLIAMLACAIMVVLSVSLIAISRHLFALRKSGRGVETATGNKTRAR